MENNTAGKRVADRLAARIAALGVNVSIVRQYGAWWTVQVGLTNGCPPSPVHHVSFRDDGSPVGFISGYTGNPWRGGPLYDAYQATMEEVQS